MTEKTKAEAPAVQPAPPPAPIVMMSPADAARQREMDIIQRQQAKQDEARARSGTVAMVAHVGFTVIDDDSPDGRVVSPGERFEVSGYDAPAYLGRARLAADEPAEARGPSIS
ncbi:hypothetical protein [Falsiroseomonas sp. CW058]|uniref:hypothetical protein n=1 Tax=Falsiroseomonas sp. CW058 TaxID=3388664 RepID=UPI003D310666